MPGIPAKVSVRRVPATMRSLRLSADRATPAPRMTSGARPNVLEKRTRSVLPASVGRTIWRTVAPAIALAGKAPAASGAICEDAHAACHAQPGAAAAPVAKPAVPSASSTE
jgi:hypothetical protein